MTPSTVDPFARRERYPLASRYDPQWLLALDMGPHPLWQLEGLLPELGLRPGDRVLDLGCGKGATSVFLAREADVDVVAVDLWVSAEEIAEVSEGAGVADRVQALQADVWALPFAEHVFDAIVSVDAFEYFGTDARLLPTLVPVLRPGGRIAVSTPALAADPDEVDPPAVVTDLVGEEAAAWHAPQWWQRHWTSTALLSDVRARMQPGSRDDWICWAHAAGEAVDSPLLTMLTSLEPDEIGFALLSAVRR